MINAPSEHAIQTSSRPLARNYSSAAQWLQILLDQLAVVLVLFGHVLLKTGDIPGQYNQLAVTTVLLMALVYRGLGIYSRRKSPLSHSWMLFKAWICVMIALVVIGFVTKTSASYSREVILTWSVTGFLIQLFCFRVILYLQSKSESDTISSLVIGAGPLAKHLAKHINENDWVPDKIVGVVESNSQLVRQWSNQDVPILGTLDDISQQINEHNIRRLYIALPCSKLR